VTRPLLSRGDVVLTRFPFTDLTGDALRPAVVVSQGQIGQDIVLIAISSVVRGALAPTDYTIESAHPEFALRSTCHVGPTDAQIGGSGTVGHCASPWAARPAAAGRSRQDAPRGVGAVDARRASMGHVCGQPDERIMTVPCSIAEQGPGLSGVRAAG
jgi:hypothetical protein